MTQDELIRELISAYVDETLTADERRRVEAYLRSPQWRQYYEELVQLREAMRSLPSYTPSRDVAEVIAERLTDATTPVPCHGKRKVAQSRWLPFLSWRWSLPVAAAAGILMVGSLVWYAWQGAGDAHRRPGEHPGLGGAVSPLAQRSGALSSGSASRRAEQGDRSGAEAANGKDLAARPPRPRIDGTPRQENSQAAQAPSTAPAQATAVGSPPRPRATGPGDDVIPVLALVIDLVLTDKGIEEHAVERSLQSAGIPVGQVIPVDPSLEKVMLAHRAFGAIRREDLPDSSVRQPGRRPYLQLMFLIATGRQYDVLLHNLYDLRASGDVALLQLDLAMGSSDTALFATLDRVSQAVSADDVRGPAVAHPFLLDDHIRGRLSDALAAAQKKQAVGQLPLVIPPSESERETTPAKPEDLKDMESWLFKVLLIARSESQVRGAP